MLLLLSTGFAVLRVKFEGEDLGDNIASILNKRMRGRIEIGSIEWSTGALKQVVTGGWVPVTMRNIRVWDDCALSSDVAGALDELRTGDPNEDCTPDERPDPDPNSKRKPRKLLLRTDLITAEVDIHALMFGKHDFVFRNLWIHGGEAVIEETDEPYPLHAYDRTIVSIVTAFYPRMSAGFRAGIYADSAPPIFDLRDIHIANLNLTIHMNPYVEDGVFGYVTTIRMEGVNVDSGPEPRNDSFLYMDPTDPLVAKFYLKLGVTAKRGVVRIFDEGPRDTFRMPVPQVAGSSAAREVYPPAGRSAKYQVALAEIQLNRLAHMPTDWARKNFVANTLELDVQARTLPCATPANASPDPATGALIRFSGELQNWFDRPFDGAWNLALDVQNFGPTIRSCIKSNIGGDDLHGRITLTGPFIANPAIGLDLKNLDFDVPLRANEEPLRLTLAEVHGRIDMVNEQGYIDKTKALIRGGKEPGEVEIAATFGLKPYNADATIEIVKAIDVGRFLPPSVSGPVGKFLQGRLRAKGDAMYGFALEDFDLALGPTPTQKAIRVHKGRLFTDDDFDSIQIQKVQVDAGRSHALFDGFVNILANDMKVRIEGEFPDLDVWMKRFGLPAFFKSAGGGVIIIQGPLDKPRINVATELGGVPCLDKLRIVDMEYSSDTGMVDIRRITSAGLGGELTGSGRIRAPDKDKPGDRARIEILKLAGVRIDASRLCGLKGTVKGTLETLDLELANTTIDPNRGALDWLESTTLYAKSDKLDVLGDKYSSVAICVNRKDDRICRPRDAYLDGDDRAQCEQGKKGNGFCAVASATRDAGGLIDATVVKLPALKTGRLSLGERLGGSIALHDLPLSILEQFAGTDMAGGLASTTLHLAGSPLAPQANGALQLLRAWAAQVFLGDAQLTVEPATIDTNKPAIAIRGTLLAGRLRIDAVVGTAAPYPVELAISGRRIELDVLLGLQQRLGLPEPLQAWVSGTVTVKTELAPKTPIEPEAWIELTEMRATITHRSADGRLTPLTLSVFDRSNGQRPAMSLRATPSSIELACKDPGAKGGRVECPTFVATPAGILEIRGSASPKRISLHARGDLDLRQIAPLFDTTFEELKGIAALTASVSGTYEKPNYEAELRLKDVSAQPVGGDTILEAPSGLIRLANGSLGFTDVKVQVRDRHRDEAGDLHIKGNISLDGLKPVGWGILIDGKIAGKMLLVAVPSAVSQASGLARIEGDLLLSGKGPRPTISGTIDFAPLPVCPKGEERMADGAECRQATEPHRPLAIIPRGVRRELTFGTGSVDIDTEAVGERRTYKISLNGISTSIDGEGTLSGIDGRIELRDGVLTKLDVRLDADDIPFRLPGTLDLILTARRITIDKASEHSTLEVGGIITIIDGTFNRNFALTDQLVSIAAPATVPTKPFWEEYPTIGSANLDLDLEVRRFTVKNNIAQIELSGDLEISNTPRDPRLAGRISVARGRFRVPGTRAPFTETSGSIDFAENERAGNPELNVESDAVYRDQSGQEHLITLSLTGKLERLQWDLKTSTGYNKSQTLSLLVLGRNPEQLRRSLGDQSLGSDPTTGDPTTNPSGGFADQIVKDLAGDWVSSLLGDSLEKYTPFDVLRIEIGFGSIGFHVEKKVLENMRLLGDTEQTIRGNTINGRAEFDGPLGFRVQLGYLNKNFNDPAEQDIEDRSLKLVKLFIW